MVKTTKKGVNRGIVTMQRFNRTDNVKSITIKGTTALADVEADNFGNVDLVLKRDTTKADKEEVKTLQQEVATLQVEITELKKQLIK